MTRTLPITLAVTTAFLAVEPKPQFVSRIPNGANVDGVTALGHADGTGSSSKLNVFGKAFDKAGLKWTTSLCQADSDGDGQTNGQELGDPCCVWTSGATPKFTSGVSHPGDASRKVSASVLATYSCNSNSTSSSTTPATTPVTTSAAWTTVTADVTTMTAVTTAMILAQW